MIYEGISGLQRSKQYQQMKASGFRYLRPKAKLYNFSPACNHGLLLSTSPTSMLLDNSFFPDLFIHFFSNYSIFVCLRPD